MAIDDHNLRRQIAWACFEPHLSETQLIGAIDLLENHFKGDSISHIIHYVSAVCAEFGIDDATRKALYNQFHQMLFDQQRQ